MGMKHNQFSLMDVVGKKKEVKWFWMMIKH